MSPCRGVQKLYFLIPNFGVTWEIFSLQQPASTSYNLGIYFALEKMEKREMTVKTKEKLMGGIVQQIPTWR
jgi:hypothetical protein